MSDAELFAAGNVIASGWNLAGNPRYWEASALLCEMAKRWRASRSTPAAEASELANFLADHLLGHGKNDADMQQDGKGYVEFRAFQPEHGTDGDCIFADMTCPTVEGAKSTEIRARTAIRAAIIAWMKRRPAPAPTDLQRSIMELQPEPPGMHIIDYRGHPAYPIGYRDALRAAAELAAKSGGRVIEERDRWRKTAEAVCDERPGPTAHAYEQVCRHRDALAAKIRDYRRAIDRGALEGSPSSAIEAAFEDRDKAEAALARLPIVHNAMNDIRGGYSEESLRPASPKE